MMCVRFRERTLLTVRSQIPKIAFSFICRRLLSNKFVKKNRRQLCSSCRYDFNSQSALFSAALLKRNINFYNDNFCHFDPKL